MIGFYLAVDKMANTVGELFRLPFEASADMEALGRPGLHIFSDDRLQIAHSNGYTTFSIGSLIYKNKWQKQALELIIYDLNNDKAIEKIMHETRGQFCLVVHSPENILVITDKLGSFPVYKFEDTNTIQISNLFLPLAKRNNVTINYQALAEYLSFDYCFGGTFFNEISLLEKGRVYKFGLDVEVHVYDDFPAGMVFRKYKEVDEVSHLAHEILASNLSFLEQHNGRIFADLTGGFDTRTIATLLKSMDIDFETGISGEQILNESRIAQEVAKSLQVKHHDDIKITDEDTFNKIVNQHFAIANWAPFLYHSSELIYYYEYIKQNFDIHVTGFAGSQLFDQFLPRLGFFSCRLKPKSLFEKTYKFKDIIRDTFITKAPYYERLTKKITALLEKIGSDIHEEVACFFPVATFNKYYHGPMIGTHNALMPSYCPYLESNIVRLMIETAYNLKKDRTVQRALLTKLNPQVSSIMTSHGYNANIDSKDTEWLFRKATQAAKNVSRQMIYELGFPVKIMRVIQSSIRKVKPPTDLALIHRSFWVDEVEDNWSDDMEIFEVLDRAKFAKQLAGDPYITKLKAKVTYLNRIMNECKPKL